MKSSLFAVALLALGHADGHEECSALPKSAFEPVTLKNSKGMSATMIAYGATMTHVLVPDASGVERDVLLGWDDRTKYCTSDEHPYFGATIGRVANRIAGCAFELDGKQYNVSCNEKDFDTLHGGSTGWDRRVWTALVSAENSVTWSYLSPDGEMGFPGEVHVNVTHTITEDNEWSIEYSALAVDRDTIIAMTNHAYFNLNANVDNTPTTMEHILHMPTATKLLEVTTAPNYHLIPTGKLLNIAHGSPFDFTSPKPIGKDVDQGVVTAHGGYDNAFIFEKHGESTELSHVATLSSPLTGIQVDMFTDQRSVQVYTGNFLNGTDADPHSDSARIPRKQSQSFGKEPQYYHYRGAVTLEAQGFPDAVHHDHFPSAKVEAGSSYAQRTKYKFSAQPGLVV